MSRKLVLVGTFLAVLPLLVLLAKSRGGDPPKDAGGTPTPPKASASGPVGDADFTDPEELKLLRNSRWKVASDKPKVDVAVVKGDGAKPKPSSGPELHGGEKAILKALKQKASLECDGTPLKDLLAYLSDKYCIPIRMDSAALKEAGVDEGTPVTCKVSGISLLSALEIILDDLQLKWVIHHEVLMITSPAKAESDEFMYTKCYDVTDLVAPPKEFNLQNPVSPVSEKFGVYENDIAPLPFVISGCAVPVGIRSGVGSQGGAASVANNIPPAILAAVGTPQAASANGMRSFPYDYQPLEDLIVSTIATKTWQDNGGTGTIAHDFMLVVSQTREVHMQIEQFLDDLRERRQARPVFSVELHWLWLDAKHRGHLLAGREKASDGQVSLTVDRQRLRQTAREVPGFNGQVACMNGLPTVLAAGDRRSIIMNATPVVDGVGYLPVVSVPNVGVTAQVRATLVPGTKTAMLDFAGIITRWGPERKPAIVAQRGRQAKKLLPLIPCRVRPAWAARAAAWAAVSSPSRPNRLLAVVPHRLHPRYRTRPNLRR